MISSRLFAAAALAFMTLCNPAQACGLPNSRDSKVARVQQDFNGDGKSDILWSSIFSPYWGMWLMDGVRAISYGVIQGEPSNALAHPDLDGDGKADIIWHTGGMLGFPETYRASLMDGLSTKASAPLNSGTGLRLCAVADLNGDGKDDLIWSQAGGWAGSEYYAWLMDGLVPMATSLLFAPGQGHIRGVGDFNGDGRTDLIGYDSNGSLRVWLMDGLSAFAAYDLLPAGSPYAGLNPYLLGDFDGDGRSDLLLGAGPDQASILWLIEGGTIKAAAALPPVSSGRFIAGDFDGDGADDLVFEPNEGGGYYIALMDGIVAREVIADPAGTLVGRRPRDFDGDGTLDFLVNEPFSDIVRIILMRGGREAQNSLVYVRSPPMKWRPNLN